MRPPTRAAVLAASLALSLTACGGDGPAQDGHPFAGTWHGAGGAGTGAGGTTLTVTEDGKVTYKSTVDCTGTATPSNGAYTFAFDCRISRFTGTAKPPNGAKTFTMTWSEGDTTEFNAAS